MTYQDSIENPQLMVYLVPAADEGDVAEDPGGNLPLYMVSDGAGGYYIGYKEPDGTFVGLTQGPTTGAPNDATYWTSASNPFLTSEVNIGAIGTGIIKVAAGVPSIATAGTDYVTLAGMETLSNKTIVTPTIASFTNAQHSHTDAAGGGTLNASAIAAGTLMLARGGTHADLSATGGTGQFLKQSTGGADITVSVIVSADINSALTTPGPFGSVTPNTVAGTTGTFSDIVMVTLVTEQLRLRYDATKYTSFTVSSTGNLTVAPSGGDTFLTSRLAYSGASFTDTFTILEGTAAVSVAGSATARVVVRLNPTVTITAANQTSSFTGQNMGLTLNNGGFNMTSTPIQVRALNVPFTISGTSGTITYAGGLNVTVTSSAGATLTNLSGISFSLGASTANITSMVGITTAALTVATNTTYLGLGITSFSIPSGNWGAYVFTANDNAFAGNVRIGSTTAPTVALDVTGAVKISTTLAVTSTTTFSGAVTFSDVNQVYGTSTGTKLGTATTQKIGAWNTTPIVQPTTAIAAATFVTNTSGTLNDSATWDGYTIGQVVKALRNIGWLA